MTDSTHGKLTRKDERCAGVGQMLPDRVVRRQLGHKETDLCVVWVNRVEDGMSK